jgi:hypothetical protein
VAHIRAPVANDNGDDIETNANATRPTLTHPSGREPPQARLFEGCNRLSRVAPAVCPPGLHLAKDKQIFPTSDEIDLALWNSPVAVEDIEALALEQASRGILAHRSQSRSRIHGATLGRGYDEKGAAPSLALGLVSDAGRLRDQVPLPKLGQLFNV